MRRALPAALLPLALAALVAGCGESASTKSAQAAGATCPKVWRAGWQKLADEIEAPVYCPRWMPRPLDAKVGGAFANGRSVDPKNRSYLVSFAWLDRDLGGVSGEVHVNFRGYPGSTSIPTCPSTLTVNGVTKRTTVPCFADRRRTKRIGGEKATAYTVNQGADQWHVLYAWRRNGSLYTVSEHVAPPFSYRQVVGNLDRMMRGLALVQPSG